MNSNLSNAYLKNPQYQNVLLKRIKSLQKPLKSYKDNLLYEVISNVNLETLSKEDAIRIDQEFEIIERHKKREKIFESFFLLYQIFLIAKKNNILFGPGRSSYPSSLILHILGISKVNPLNYDLFFEKFINDNFDHSIEIDVSNKDLLIDVLKESNLGYRIYPVIIDKLYLPKAAINEVFYEKGVSNSLTKEITALISKESLLSPLSPNDISNIIEKNFSNFFNLNKNTVLKALSLIGTKKGELNHYGKVAFSKKEIKDSIRDDDSQDIIVFSFLNSVYLKEINLKKQSNPKHFTDDSIFEKLNSCNTSSETIKTNLSLIHSFFPNFRIQSIQDLARVVAFRNKENAENFMNGSNIFYQEDLIQELVNIGFLNSDACFLFKKLCKNEYNEFYKTSLTYSNDVWVKFFEKKDYFIKISPFLFSKSHAISYAYLYYTKVHNDIYK